MKLTPWFPGVVKPERVGVYERQYFREQLEPRYSYWNGYKWSTWAPTPKGALDLWYTVGALQDLPWRGVMK